MDDQKGASDRALFWRFGNATWSVNASEIDPSKRAKAP